MATPIEKQRAYKRDWMRRWRAANPERHRENTRRWAAANPEKKREIDRRARMKSPLEATVEQYLVDGVRARDGLCIKFADAGRRGAPDRLVVLRGLPTLYVELKRPRRSHGLSDAQKRYHQSLRDRGQRVWTLWSREDVDAFLREVAPA